MKKKIALLLAVIMTVSLMPVTIFAGSSNYLEKGTLTLKKDTRYDGTDLTPIPSSSPTAYYGNPISNALVLEMKEGTPNYEQKFRIQLTNAKFSNVVSFNGGEDANGTQITASASAGAFMDSGTLFDTTAITRGAFWKNTIKVNGATMNVTSPGVLDIQLDAGTDDIATVTISSGALYAPSNKISIPLPIKTDDISDADISVTIIDNNSLVSTGTYLISRTTGSATNTTVKEIKTGRELITVADIIMKEKLVGSYKNLKSTARAFEIYAPAGYEFIGASLTTVKVTGTGEFSGLSIAAIQTTRDGASVVIGTSGSGVVGTGVSTKLPEAIVVSGLQVQPIDNDVVSFGETLQMGVYKYSGSLMPGYTILDGLTEQTFDAIKPVDWTVSVTAAAAKDVVTGRYNPSRADADQQVAAKVTFKELEKSAWISERTTDFVLPEGVSIRGVKFDTWSTSTIQQGAPGSSTLAMNKDKWNLIAAKSGGTVTATADGLVTIDKNVLSLKGIQVVDGKKAEIAFTLYLSVSPDFKEDKITLKTTGTAIPQEIPEVVIANCIQPITVTAKVTDVQIGFQKYAVGDITIKENKAGAILRNALAPVAEEGLILSIEDYISSDVTIVPIKDTQVSVEGDLKVSLRKNTAGRIAFDVDRQSTTASTITIKGVEIKIDRTVPYGVYDLVVAGQSVFANEAQTTATISTPVTINALFDDYGYTTPYINVATEGMNSPLKSNVKIAKDSDVVIVDGIQKQMMYPTYFDVSQSSFLVPARFISQIFGVEDNNIFWNDTTKTVSIITANRTLQFTAGSNVMVVAANGASSGVTMTAKAILHPVSERLYVPFRAIGDAFGVSVAYDEATGTAEYNQVK